jgi:hypothetical protein
MLTAVVAGFAAWRETMLRVNEGKYPMIARPGGQATHR